MLILYVTLAEGNNSSQDYTSAKIQQKELYTVASCYLQSAILVITDSNHRGSLNSVPDSEWLQDVMACARCASSTGTRWFLRHQ